MGLLVNLCMYACRHRRPKMLVRSRWKGHRAQLRRLAAPTSRQARYAGDAAADASDVYLRKFHVAAIVDFRSTATGYSHRQPIKSCTRYESTVRYQVGTWHEPAAADLS